MSDEPKIITLEDGEYELLDIEVGELSEQDKKAKNSYPVHLTLRKIHKSQKFDLVICPTGEKQ